MVKEIQCDLLEAPVDVISQCCNCQNTQSAGVALAIRQKWPEVYEDDLQTIKGDKTKLGTVRVVKLLNPTNKIRYVVNMYGQYYYGRDKRYLDYEALYKCLEQVNQHIYGKFLKVGIPYKIGCNNAGGSWPVVLAMIHDIFDKSENEIFICKK